GEDELRGEEGGQAGGECDEEVDHGRAPLYGLLTARQGRGGGLAGAVARIGHPLDENPVDERGRGEDSAPRARSRSRCQAGLPSARLLSGRPQGRRVAACWRNW